MLLGREGELAVVDRLLAAAQRGQSGVLVVWGDPGVGKTALMRAARERAEGMRVLAVQGLEAESQLPFAGLHELVLPILRELDLTPAPQAHALRQALMLGDAESPPLATPADVDRFAVYAGTLSIVARAAEHQPLLILVDDAQWVDDASTDALVFAARRLFADPVALLVSVRSGATSSFLQAGFEQLELGGLGPDLLAAVLVNDRGVRPPPEVSRLLAKASAGNPLAFLELAASLNDGQLTGDQPLPELLLPEGGSLLGAYGARFKKLDESEQLAAVIAAVSDSGALDLIAHALAAVGLDMKALYAAEDARLVEIRPAQLRFAHPLMRSAVCSAATGEQRRRAHAALAEVLTSEADAERRAWHLAAAAMGPSEDVAQTLEDAAAKASRRSGYAEGARALELAARLTPAENERARRLLWAADAAGRAGRPAWARGLADEAADLASNPDLRSEVSFRRAHIAAWSGELENALDAYLSEGGRLRAIDPRRAARVLSHASTISVIRGRTATGFDSAQRAYDLERAAGQSEWTMELTVLQSLGCVMLLLGATPEGSHLINIAAERHVRADDLTGAEFTASCLIWIEEYARARGFLEPVAERARADGDLGTLAEALELLAEVNYRTGRWIEAYACASESAQLAEEIGLRAQLPYSLGLLAIVEAATGREAECRRDAERASELGVAMGLELMTEYVGTALGLLELGLGRPDAGVEHFARAAAFAAAADRGEPAVLFWPADRVEALAAAGQRGEAMLALEAFDAQTQMTNRICAKATAARCRGLLSHGGTAREHFEAALRLHDSSPTPFERARTELAFGDSLQRSGQRADALRHLGAARTEFDRLGASPWSVRVERAISACGAPPRSSETQQMASLTGRELQVALAVAHGSTSRQAGARLFLSRRTIDSHLHAIYRKLGIRTHGQLVECLRPAGDDRDATAQITASMHLLPNA